MVVETKMTVVSLSLSHSESKFLEIFAFLIPFKKTSRSGFIKIYQWTNLWIKVWLGLTMAASCHWWVLAPSS